MSDFRRDIKESMFVMSDNLKMDLGSEEITTRLRSKILKSSFKRLGSFWALDHLYFPLDERQFKTLIQAMINDELDLGIFGYENFPGDDWEPRG